MSSGQGVWYLVMKQKRYLLTPTVYPNPLTSHPNSTKRTCPPHHPSLPATLCFYNFHLLATSNPSTNVPTLASIAYPSLSSLLHSIYKSLTGIRKHSINSFSSRCCLGVPWLRGSERSIVRWMRWRLVLQKPMLGES